MHAFSTRPGGVSPEPFDSLNLGHNTDDDGDNVAENRKRFFQTLGVNSKFVAMPNQVHGHHIQHVSRGGFYPDTDALITDTPGVALTVQTADCVPLFLIDEMRPAIGLVHAGWRGSAGDIAGKTVQTMREAFGTRPENLKVFIGPSIGPCCYEIGPEVQKTISPEFFEGRHLNLWQLNAQTLVRSGVKTEHIHIAGMCTACLSDWFFSHRRSGGKTGRLMSVLMIHNI